MISFEVWQKCYKAGSHMMTLFFWLVGNHTEPFERATIPLTALIGQDAGVRTPSCWDQGLLQLGS